MMIIMINVVPTLNVRDNSHGPIGCESYPSWEQHSPQHLAQFLATRSLLQVNLFCLLNNPLRFLRIRLHRMSLMMLPPDGEQLMPLRRGIAFVDALLLELTHGRLSFAFPVLGQVAFLLCSDRCTIGLEAEIF